MDSSSSSAESRKPYKNSLTGNNLLQHKYIHLVLYNEVYSFHNLYLHFCLYFCLLWLLKVMVYNCLSCWDLLSLQITKTAFLILAPKPSALQASNRKKFFKYVSEVNTRKHSMTNESDQTNSRRLSHWKNQHICHPTQGERPTSYLPYILCTLALLPARIPAAASLADLSSTSGSLASISAWTQPCRKLWNAMLPNIPVPLPFFHCLVPILIFFFLDSAWISVNLSPTYPNNMPLYSFKVRQQLNHIYVSVTT